MSIHFSPDGRRCMGLAAQNSLRVWDVLEPPVPVPTWFCEFVEAVSGKHVNAHHEVEPVDRESIMPFRRKFAEAREADFYSRWANWFLHERLMERAPEFVP